MLVPAWLGSTMCAKAHSLLAVCSRTVPQGLAKTESQSTQALAVEAQKSEHDCPRPLLIKRSTSWHMLYVTGRGAARK